MYEPSRKAVWDEFVSTSRNGTFLLQRNYMDYHADRFSDHSLMVFGEGALLAVLPANLAGSDLHSHQGLTYGGFIVADRMGTAPMLAIFESVLEYLRREGVRRVHYKTVPHIYCRFPADEDRYALFRCGAQLSRRDVLCALRPGDAPPRQTRRKRGAVKARAAGIEVRQSEDWQRFWRMLTDHLRERYGLGPVHSYEEIALLHERFPSNIRLFGAYFGEELVSGTVVYETSRVAHVQYIGTTEKGRELSAHDLVVHHLLGDVFHDKPWLDFGISNEQEGRFLNLGLIEQKEGYGGRAVAHDFYRIDL